VSAPGPALVVLAAGASRRLGEPKALARLRARSPATPLEWLLDAGSVLGDTRPLVVTGPDHDAIARLCPAVAELAWNEHAEQGRTGSVQLALRHRPGRDLCLAPVDVPVVEPAVFQALVRAWDEHGRPAQGWLAPWIRAGAGRRFGHPVLIGRELLLRLEGFSAGQPLSALRAGAGPLLAIEVGSDSILLDLDTPADLARIRARLAALESPG
jgi:CTP:molybdopterin cytidylyltransferase MocA